MAFASTFAAFSWCFRCGLLQESLFPTKTHIMGQERQSLYFPWKKMTALFFWSICVITTFIILPFILSHTELRMENFTKIKPHKRICLLLHGICLYEREKNSNQVPFLTYIYENLSVLFRVHRLDVSRLSNGGKALGDGFLLHPNLGCKSPCHGVRCEVIFSFTFY